VNIYLYEMYATLLQLREIKSELFDSSIFFQEDNNDKTCRNLFTTMFQKVV